MRVALFGGSFNPPHVGHLLGALYIRAVTEVDAVWLMPAYHHPFGKKLAPFADRVAMCEEIAGMVDGLSVTRVESEVEGDGRTIRTVEHLVRRYPEHSFRLVIGTDILHEAHRWYDFERLIKLAPLYVLGRSGHLDMPKKTWENAVFLHEVPIPEVSSTHVRQRLEAGEDVSAWVPRKVLEHIEKHRLYRAGESTGGGAKNN